MVGMQRHSSSIEVLDDAMADVLRQKTPAERLAIANSMWRFAQRMIESTLRAEHPDWNHEQIQRETANRLSHGAV